MINEQDMQDAIADFQKHFGNHESPLVGTQVVNGEEMIVIENSRKRAFYTVGVQLIKLINLGEDN